MVILYRSIDQRTIIILHSHTTGRIYILARGRLGRDRMVVGIKNLKNQRENLILISKLNKGNAKRGVSPRLKIRPCDL